MGRCGVGLQGLRLRALRDASAGPHTLLYYSLLWLWWGAVVGQSAVSLRLLSWLAYGLCIVVMVAQARQLAVTSHRQRARERAALLAFCSPYPVRLPIEGKSCALLVLSLAVLLALWCQRSFLGIDASQTDGREADDFHAISALTAGQVERFGPRPGCSTSVTGWSRLRVGCCYRRSPGGMREP